MRWTVFIILLLVCSSCEKERGEQQIPFSFVNQDINLNLIQYQDLKNIGGYIYIEGGANAGFKGLIVYHEGNGTYKAFERACSYDPFADCDPVIVDDSGLFLVHECCNSTFNFNGNPMSGPASLDLLQYSTFVDGIYLKIRNN
ncbi:MAG: hypothetical protein MI975_27635 [Cytophagales bacterium]|nr:hypothetical protein [Cytophagales bacterium]